MKYNEQLTLILCKIHASANIGVWYKVGIQSMLNIKVYTSCMGRTRSNLPCKLMQQLNRGKRELHKENFEIIVNNINTIQNAPYKTQSVLI